MWSGPEQDEMLIRLPSLALLMVLVKGEFSSSFQEVMDGCLGLIE